MSKRYDDARRGLDAASRAIARLRLESGAEQEPPREGDAAGLRAALDAARRALEDKSASLETARERIRQLEREREELLSRSAGSRPDPELAERAKRAEAEAAKAKQALAAESAALNGRLSIQQAEFVRLNSLRRKAESAAEQSELARREVEDALRRDLRTVHAALDRAAAEAGAREARAQSDIQGLTRRLEAALTRTEQLSREQQLERDRWRAERSRLASTLQRSSAVQATLRRELAELGGGPDARVERLTRSLGESEVEVAKARADARAAAEEQSAKLAAAEAEAAKARVAAEARAEQFTRRLAAAEAELAKARASGSALSAELARRLAVADAELTAAREAKEDAARKLSEAERALWDARADLAARESDRNSAPLPEEASALVARLKPAAAAAYERLRELSAVIPLSDAERASLRRAASAVAGLSDAVGVVERFLDGGPTGEPGPLAPALGRAVSDWEAALKRKGCRLDVDLQPGLGAAVFDPPDLRLVLDQLLRRAFETLPARCGLRLTARRAGDAVEAVLEDDGPGFSTRGAAAAFKAGSGAQGLALPLARRALRRWGGDARLEKSPSGGARLVLTFLAA